MENQTPNSSDFESLDNILNQEKPKPAPNPTPPPPPSPSISKNIPINTQTKSKFDAIAELTNTIKSTPSTPTPNTPPPPSQPSAENPILTLLFQYKYYLVGLLFLIIVIIVGYSIIKSRANNQGTLHLAIDNAPDSLTINEQSYPALPSQDIILKPGNYSISAYKKDYFPASASITITAQKTSDISLSLTPYPSPVELIKYPAKFPHLNPQETEIIYLSNYGSAFYKINTSTSVSASLSPNSFNNVDDIFWAPSVLTASIIKSTNNPTQNFYKQNILYQSDCPAGSTVYMLYDYSKYDLVSQTFKVYPETIHYPSWHPSKEEIIYQYLDPKTSENTLSKSSPNLNDREPLTDLGDLKDVKSKYSYDAEMIAMLDTASQPNNPNNIYIFYTVSKKLEKIPTKNTYTDFYWSYDNTKLLAINSDFSLFLIDVQAQTEEDLNTRADSNHVAWFHSKPWILVSLANQGQPDQLVYLDTTTKNRTPLKMVTTTPFTTISNPIISRDDSTLYFTANDTEHLYSLSISQQ